MMDKVQKKKIVSVYYTPSSKPYSVVCWLCKTLGWSVRSLFLSLSLSLTHTHTHTHTCACFIFSHGKWHVSGNQKDGSQRVLNWDCR